MNQDSSQTQPSAIDRTETGIQITWQDGQQSRYSSYELRQRCPCAVCKETPGHPKPKPIPQNAVTIKAAHPMGWYAIQFIFSDGHDTGIYPYEYLRKISSENKNESQT